MPIRYLFSSTRIDDTEKKYVATKILKCRKLLRRYPDETLTTEVEIKQDKKGFWNVKTMIQTPHELYRVSKQSSDLFLAVDMLEEALMKQICRNKEKIRDLSRKKRKLANTRV